MKTKHLDLMVIAVTAGFLAFLIFVEVKVAVLSARRSCGPLDLPRTSLALGSPLAPEPGKTGRKVSIPAGEVRVLDLLQFLSDSSGLPLVYDLNDPSITEKELLIVTPIGEADYEVVKTILLANRYPVFREILPGGREVLKVEPMRPLEGSQLGRASPREFRIILRPPGVS
jgi:hypothetical protein